MTDLGQIAGLVFLAAGFGAGIVFGMSMTYNNIRKKGTYTTKKGTYQFTPTPQ